MNRRSDLFLSTGAAIGALLVPEVAPVPAEERGSVRTERPGHGVPQTLRYTEVPGFLSAVQIAPHHTAQYAGALRAFNSVQAEFENSFANDVAIAGPAFDRM